MSDTCPTVKVASDKAPGGFIIINESDFDPKLHKKYGEKVEGGLSGDDDDDPNLKLRGPLPDDFPSHAALDAAGYSTYGKVRKLVARGEGWYKEVSGIGDKTFSAVEEALKEK